MDQAGGWDSRSWMTALVVLAGLFCACDGEQLLSCPHGTVDCDGVCRDTRTDGHNCGECGTACRSGEVCSSGTCGLSCVGGATICSGKCVDTQLDPQHCGGCSTPCTSGQVCSAGKCGLSCAGGMTICSGKCVDTQLDPQNCGKCGNACTSGLVCSAGKCVLHCAGGTTACSGKCVDTAADPKHCGKCGAACLAGHLCSAGKCLLNCAGGTAKCGVKCVDTKVDVKNCGKCGITCGSGQMCCSGTCADTSSDTKHCGVCGVVCPGTCIKGVCCGNGKLDSGEQCDGSVLGGKACKDVGKNGGTLACTSMCTLNTSGCTWVVSAGGSYYGDYGHAVAVDTKGNSYVTGTYDSAAIFGSTVLKAMGPGYGMSFDNFVTKIDASGKFLWAVSAGGSSWINNSLDIALDTKGNSHITGNFSGGATFGSTTVTSNNWKREIFVAKLDSKGKFLWAISAGGQGNDEGQGIAVDSQGNSYVAGYFQDKATFGSLSLASKDASSSDFFVAKVDSSGNYLWVASVETDAGGSYKGCGIALDSQGSSYITGDFHKTASFGSTTITAKGASYGIFVAKVDSSGKHLWAVPVGLKYPYWAGRDIALDGKGNSYIAGNFDGTATFGTITLTSASYYGDNIFVAKLDSAAGKFLWAVSAGGTYGDRGNGIAVDGLGNSYVTGGYTGTVTFGSTTLTTSPGWYTDIFVTKLDQSGKFIWAVSAGSTSDDTGYGIAVDSQGNSHVTGYFVGSATFGQTSLTGKNSDIFVWKLDKNGK